MQVCQVSASSSLRFLIRRILNIFRKFTLYVAPSLSYLDKSRMKHGGLLNKYFSKKKSNIPNDLAEIVNFHFSHYKSMGTISCHSNQSSYPTGIKKHNLCRGLCPKHVCQVSASSPIWFLRIRFLNIFYENRPFLPPRQPIKFTDLDKIHMKRRGLLNKHFCKKKSKYPLLQKELSISSFPIISIWEL